MQRNVIIGLIVVLVVVLGFVWIAKPTLPLPTVTVPLAANDPMGAFQRQLKINELNVKIRTDGKVSAIADGKELAYTSYNPASLANAIDLAERHTLSPAMRTGVTVFQWIFQRLTWNVFLTGLSLYYGLPVEINIRFIPG